MNDSELNRLLKAAKVPERSGDFWTELPRRVVGGLHWRPAAPAPEPNWFPRLGWGLAALATCLVIGFVIGHRHGLSEADRLLQSPKMIQEMLAMFPNRVRAIVQDERGISLVLSDNPDVPASTPLWLSISDGKHSSTLVTFSGQELQVAGKKLEVLANARGQVMVVGDRLLWSSAGANRTSGNLRIQAKPLDVLL